MKPKKHSAPGKARPAAPAAQASSSRKFWPWLLAAFLGLFVLFEVYQPAINGPFLFDDRSLPFLDPGFVGVSIRAWVKGLRPVLMFTYWLNYTASGLEPYSYHVVNVALHYVDGVLVFFILRRLLDWAKTDAATRDVLAAFGSALFLFHPLATESVTYVASRSESLSVLLINGAFAAFLWRRKAAISFAGAAVVLVLFGAACLAKEHAVVLPVLLLLTDYFWNPGFSFAGIKRNWRLYVPMAVLGAAGLAYVLRIVTGAKTAGFSITDFTWYQYFFTQCRAIWVYLRMFVLPFGLNVDHDFAISRNLLDQGAIFGLAGLIALAGAAWYYRQRFPLASYGVFMTLLLLAPTSSFVPIKDTLVEHRTYLPFIGMILISLEALRAWKPPRTTLIATLAVIVVACCVLTYRRNQDWSTAVGIWKDASEKSPRKARPRFQLAFAYYDGGDCPAAAREYQATSKLQPVTYELLVDWALALDCAGQPDEALKQLAQAAALERTVAVYASMGMVYGKQGRRKEALDALDIAEQMNPRFVATYLYRGNVFATAGQYSLAGEQYRKALAIDPASEQARQALAGLPR